MTCRHIQSKLLDGAHLTPAETVHVEECGACSAFAADLACIKQSVQNMEQPALPGDVRRSTLKQAHVRMAMSKSKPGLPAAVPAAVWIVVGFSLLVCAGFLGFGIYAYVKNGTLSVFYIITMLLIIQNAAALVFGPVIIKHAGKMRAFTFIDGTACVHAV